MELETQHSLAKAVSEDSSSEPTMPSSHVDAETSKDSSLPTSFSRFRNRRRTFGSNIEDSLATITTVPVQVANVVMDGDDDEEEGDSSGLFDTASDDDSRPGNKVPHLPSARHTAMDAKDEPSVVERSEVVSKPDVDSSGDEMELDDVEEEEGGSDTEQQQEQEIEEDHDALEHANETLEKVQESDAAESDLENNPVDDDNEEENEETSKHMTPESESDEAQTAARSDDSLREKESTFNSGEKKLPTRRALVESTDQLFLQVTNREAVTVKDILQSLQTEFECPKFDKESKTIVRERLTGLILGKIQPLEGLSSDDDEGEEEEEEHEALSSEEEPQSDSEASGSQPDGEEDSDFDAPAKRRRKPSRKRIPNQKPAKERRSLVKRKSAAAVKAAAVRIQAEQLRKKRLEELRVRNEELQLVQNEQEQKRAAQIAAKLETDTEEMRLARLEQRLDLLQKLDQKRITVIQDTLGARVKQEPEPEAKEQESEEEEEEEDSSDDEMELELVGKPTRPLVSAQSDSLSILSWADKGIRIPTKMKNAVNTVSKANNNHTNTNEFSDLFSETRMLKASPGQSLNARALLRRRLLSRQRQMGNRWLARELGYQTEKEHVQECLKVENQKRLLVMKKEQERIQSNERKLLRERLLQAENEAEMQGDDEDDEDEDYQEPGDGNQSDAAEGDPSDDEEMAMARELEKIDSGTGDQTPNDDILLEQTDDATEAAAPNVLHGESTVNDECPSVKLGLVAEVSRDSVNSAILEQKDAPDQKSSEAKPLTPVDGGSDHVAGPLSLKTEREQGSVSKSDVSDSAPTEDMDPTPQGFSSEVEDDQLGSQEETEKEEESPGKPKGPRNSVWREMLKREAEQLKKRKKHKRDMIDDEAEEEEEEEIVGLEDFGFAVHKKKNQDDADENEGDDEIDEEDLKDVVDDVSDGEGDEDAGEEARKAMEAEEEKERHKEIMRRMREGYDGRRGGIAGGGVGARGVHRFDELVAADNREDAKRLGLLNDDEMDSEDEKDENADDDEEEDEAMLLDKMLKDRFLHRSSVDLEENFSEDEEENEENNGTNAAENQEDLEEKEQERIAKRFTKRARMQRLIEAHGHDEEFSQMKLIEEDLTLKEELQKIKNGLVRKRSQSNSLLPSDNSNLSGAGSSKRQRVGVSAFAPSSGRTSLSIALQASRRKPTRTSFLRGSSAGSSETSASFQRSVGFKHVIFQSSNSRASSMGGNSKLPPLTSLPAARMASSGVSKSSSLWSNASRGFPKRH